MRFSLAIRNLFSLLLLLLFLNSCKKTDSSNNNPPSSPPAITPIGTPVGNPVNKIIGSAAGSLVSPDGRLELNVPAGALSSNTTISIQPVTNEAPGGIGLSYHLMPDGIKFLKPVTLVYHYSDDEMNGTVPYLLYIGYQDSLRQWKADFKNRNIDTIGKTVSFTTTHFSIWSLGSRVIMLARPGEVGENETSEVTVEHIDVPSQSGSGPDDLPSLPISSLLSDQSVINWKVNGTVGGNTRDGTILGSGSKINYKAPSSIEMERTVQVAAELNYSISFYNNGRLVSSTNRLILFKNIKLLPSEFEYTVETDFSDSAVTGWRGQIYRDRSSFDLSLKKTKDNQGLPTVIVLASNFKNYAPTVSPLSQTYADPFGVFTITYDWIADGTGETNITGVTLASFDDYNSTMYLDFIHSGAVSPSFNWRTSLGQSGTSPLTPLGGSFGIPPGARIKMIRQDQSDDPWVKIKAK